MFASLGRPVFELLPPVLTIPDAAVAQRPEELEARLRDPAFDRGG